MRCVAAPGAGDAVALASDAGATGVLVTLAGGVHTAAQVRKVHSYRVDAFASVDEAKLAVVEEGVVRWLAHPAPVDVALGLASISRPVARWPRVQIVFNHVGAGGAVVEALVAHGVDGLVVAGTGNGTVSVSLEAALRAAQASGVQVLRSTRCDAGPVSTSPNALPSAGVLSPVKARIELLLLLLARS